MVCPASRRIDLACAARRLDLTRTGFALESARLGSLSDDEQAIGMALSRLGRTQLKVILDVHGVEDLLVDRVHSIRDWINFGDAPFLQNTHELREGCPYLRGIALVERGRSEGVDRVQRAISKWKLMSESCHRIRLRMLSRFNARRAVVFVIEHQIVRFAESKPWID